MPKGGSTRIADYEGCRRNLPADIRSTFNERLLGIRASASSQGAPVRTFPVGFTLGFNFFEALGVADTSGLHLALPAVSLA